MTTRQVLASRPVLARRRVLAGGALLILPATARAAEWPERPVRMIIPFAPGAGADIVGRTFAEELAKALGQPVVVDNKGGAGGLLGTVEGVRAAPDGYTLLLTSQGTTVWNLGLYKSPGYDPLKDLVPVTITGEPAQRDGRRAHQSRQHVADLVARRRPSRASSPTARAASARARTCRASSSSSAPASACSTCPTARAGRRPRRGQRRGDDGFLQHADGAAADQGRQAQGAGRHQRHR